ncbi:MAG: major facilitator superfamily transporter [Candidatus Cloacimonadota bacterium]|nr:MAG: major facilitator superfamily transporter [Candidatus Cloacimonadota bacterium]PIE78783.1 MAG: major facilitator superfamily transporter [Candidatus Delongbacteria bacterium]
MWNRMNGSMMFSQMMFGLSFYGVMIILTRFFLEKLNYSEANTMMVVGAFSAIGPLFAIAGGVIADKFLGSYRSLTISFITFAIGYGLLVWGGSQVSVPISLIGIALASYARGLMGPSYPNLFKATFDSQEDFENGYPVNYSVNNVGALIGQYFFPLLVLYIGFSGSFTLSMILAALAVVAMLSIHKPLVARAQDIDKEPVSSKNWISFTVASVVLVAFVFFMFSNMEVGKYIVYAIGGGSLLYFAFMMLKENHSRKLRMGTILIMVLLTTVFHIYYGQMMTSMTIVAINTMRGDLFGIIPIAPEGSMAMNPFWCIVAGPVLTFIFTKLEKNNICFSTATKVSFAFVLTAIAFGVLTMAILNIGEDVVIRPWVFFVIHLFQAFAEVIVGSLVMAFILSVAPKAISNFSASLFYVATALSGIIGAVFSTSIALEKGQKLTQTLAHDLYGHYFMLLTVWAVIMVVVALIASFIISRMLNSAEQSE